MRDFPPGMACGQQLARAGHDVTLFERDDRIGGLLRYGICDIGRRRSGGKRRAHTQGSVPPACAVARMA
jgi:phytoene dehydrogenase-like protein